MFYLYWPVMHFYCMLISDIIQHQHIIIIWILVKLLVDKLWESLCDLLTGGRSFSRFHRAETKDHLKSRLRNLYHSLLHAFQVRAEFTLASFPPHGDMNGVSSPTVCGSVAAWISENQPLEMCDLYFLSSFIWSECLDSFQCESPAFPYLCISFSLQHCCLTAVSPVFWFIHFHNALISQVVWCRRL